MSIDEALETLQGAGTNIRFRELLHIATHFFGEPRIRGSHHIFKMPWAFNPRINLQKDGNQAQPYQVQQVIRALKKLQDVGV